MTRGKMKEKHQNRWTNSPVKGAKEKFTVTSK